MESKQFTLNQKDLKSLWIGLLITLGGALLTYFADNLPKVDFGQWAPFIVPLAAVLINTIKKWLEGVKK